MFPGHAVFPYGVAFVGYHFNTCHFIELDARVEKSQIWEGLSGCFPKFVICLSVSGMVHHSGVGRALPGVVEQVHDRKLSDKE